LPDLRRRPLAFCALVVALVAACSGSTATPTEPPLTDPSEIVARSVENLQNVQSLHLDATLSGSIDMTAVSSLMAANGQGELPLSGSLKLDGGTASADVDVAGRAFKASAAMPRLLGLTVDAIGVDGYLYWRSNLSSAKYTKTALELPASIPTLAPGSSLDVPGAVASLQAALSSAGMTSTLIGHAAVSGRDAYRVALSVPIAILNAQIAGLSGVSGVSFDSASVDYWVYSDSLRPAKIEIKASSSSLGNLDLTVTFSKYGQAVAVAAPPASEIEQP
jgi:hypothetical protein